MATFRFVCQKIAFIEINAENWREAQDFIDNQSEDTLNALADRNGGWEWLGTPELQEF